MAFDSIKSMASPVVHVIEDDPLEEEEEEVFGTIESFSKELKEQSDVIKAKWGDSTPCLDKAVLCKLWCAQYRGFVEKFGIDNVTDTMAEAKVFIDHANEEYNLLGACAKAEMLKAWCLEEKRRVEE